MGARPHPERPVPTKPASRALIGRRGAHEARQERSVWSDLADREVIDGLGEPGLIEAVELLGGFDPGELDDSSRGSWQGKYVAMEHVGTRTDPESGLGERDTLVAFLRYQRQTLILKTADLDAAALARRSVEPSSLSLLGLVRHMADMERIHFRRILAGQDVPMLYWSRENPDQDFTDVAPEPEMVQQAWANWHEEVAFADAVDSGVPQ